MILKSEKVIENAGVAQLVEQRSCNPERFRDVGSSPITSSDLLNTERDKIKEVFVKCTEID